MRDGQLGLQSAHVGGGEGEGGEGEGGDGEGGDGLGGEGEGGEGLGGDGLGGESCRGEGLGGEGEGGNGLGGAGLGGEGDGDGGGGGDGSGSERHHTGRDRWCDKRTCQPYACWQPPSLAQSLDEDLSHVLAMAQAQHQTPGRKTTVFTSSGNTVDDTETLLRPSIWSAISSLAALDPLLLT